MKNEYKWKKMKNGFLITKKTSVFFEQKTADFETLKKSKDEKNKASGKWS